MVTKNTILSKKDAACLEDLIARNGRIVSFDQVKQVFSNRYQESSISKRVSFLADNGWLIRLKKGLYVVITDIGELSANNISMYTMVQALNSESYVSFENALRYHGMFDQMLSSVCAVTFGRARKYKVKKILIRFCHIKEELYFGFSEQKADIGIVNVAEKEKALLDLLYFRSSRYYMSLVWEKLREYEQDIDFKKLKKYALKFNLTVIRKAAFFLDTLGIATDELQARVSGETSYSRMTKDSQQFNSKWRLYFDENIIE